MSRTGTHSVERRHAAQERAGLARHSKRMKLSHRQALSIFLLVALLATISVHSGLKLFCKQDDQVAAAEVTFPYKTFVDTNGLAAIANTYPQGLYAEGANLAANDQVKIYLGRRPQVEYYYDDNYSDYKKPAPQGEIVWRFAGADGDGHYIFYVEQPLVGCEQYMGDYTTRSYNLNSRFLQAYKTVSSTYYNPNNWDPDESKGEQFQGGSTTAAKVYANHWGGTITSPSGAILGIRGTLAKVLSNTDWFKSEETDVMATKLVTTKNTKSGVDDTTSDKLWCGWATNFGSSYKTYYLSTTQGTKSCAVYRDNWDGRYWLRSASPSNSSHALRTWPGYYVGVRNVDYAYPAVSAAFELNASTFRFATTANATTTGQSTVASADAMHLRKTGCSGSVSANGAELTYTAPANSRLMVLVTDGTNTYQYCKTISSAVSSQVLNLNQTMTLTSGTSYGVRAWVEQDASTGSTVKLATAPASATFTYTPLLSSVYLGGTGGSDSNTGADASHALATMPAALAKCADGGTIYICGAVTVNNSTAQTWAPQNGSSKVTVRPSSSYTGTAFNLTGSGTLTVSNLTFTWGGSSDGVLFNKTGTGALALTNCTGTTSGTRYLVSSGSSSGAMTLSDCTLTNSTTSPAINWTASNHITAVGKVITSVNLANSASYGVYSGSNLTSGSSIKITCSSPDRQAVWFSSATYKTNNSPYFSIFDTTNYRLISANTSSSSLTNALWYFAQPSFTLDATDDHANSRFNLTLTKSHWVQGDSLAVSAVCPQNVTLTSGTTLPCKYKVNSGSWETYGTKSLTFSSSSAATQYLYYGLADNAVKRYAGDYKGSVNFTASLTSVS